MGRKTSWGAKLLILLQQKFRKNLTGGRVSTTLDAAVEYVNSRLSSFVFMSLKRMDAQQLRVYHQYAKKRMI